MTKSEWLDIKHFKPYEFKNPEGMEVGFLRWLDNVRGLAGVPMIPTSDYRPGDPRCHGSGWAIDVACHSSTARHAIVSAALQRGCQRIGVYDRHIHLDLCGPQHGQSGFPQGVMWWGKSK